MPGDLLKLGGRIALVTGAGAHGGIGSAIAVGLARQGAHVAIADTDDEGAETTASQIASLGCRSLAVHCDISNPEEVTSMFCEVDRNLGCLDILVNVPYAFPSRVHPHELTLEDWNRTLAVSLTGYFLCSKEALSRMVANGKKGCILNIGSIAGSSAMGRGNFPYSCAKGGVAQMTKELAIEYAGHGIRVNAILPAQVMTPGFKKQLKDNPAVAEKMVPRLLAGLPIGRILDPEDIVGPALFLCGEASRAVTGVLLPVDGGNLAMNAGGSLTWND
ncbi:MAG: SDR family NAD(P)-dependent oxidoreductase [Bryobacteraceae bacterium]